MVEEIGCSELEGFAQLLKDYMVDEYNLPDIHLNRVTKNNGVTRIGNMGRYSYRIIDKPKMKMRKDS